MTNGQKCEYKSENSLWNSKVNQVGNKIRTGHVNIKLITKINTYITKCNNEHVHINNINFSLFYL